MEKIFDKSRVFEDADLINVEIEETEVEKAQFRVLVAVLFLPIVGIFMAYRSHCFTKQTKALLCVYTTLVVAIGFIKWIIDIY